MNPPELRALRQLARELSLPASALDAAMDCELLAPEQSPGEQRLLLRQMSRLMHDLGVNAPGAALLVRMGRDVLVLRAELERLQRLDARWFATWHEGLWRELDDSHDTSF